MRPDASLKLHGVAWCEARMLYSPSNPQAKTFLDLHWLSNNTENVSGLSFLPLMAAGTDQWRRLEKETCLN